MEQSFLDFLNNFGQLGTVIGVILGGSALITSLVVSFKKFKSKYDSTVIQKAIDDTEFKEFTEKMNKTVEEVEKLKLNINELQAGYDKIIVELNNKINDVWAATIEYQDEVKDSSENLENRMYKNTLSIDTIVNEITELKNKIKLLIQSDIENIKLFIMDNYYKIKEKGYAEMKLVEKIESRYSIYKQEIKGDPSAQYIERIMDEIRSMPPEPPPLGKS